MNIKIRTANTDDFLEVHNLIKEFSIFIKTPEKVTITPDQMIKDKDLFRCLVAVDNFTIISFATYYFSYYSWSGKTVYLDDLYVTDNYRNHEIGTLLFDKVTEIGKDENCKKMKWQVSKWNTKAQDYYKSKGAVIDDMEINCTLNL